VKWYFIDSGASTGRFNMDYDLQLANNCNNNEGFFRVYRWHPYCISLGANQKFEDINLSLAAQHNIDVVKRPTGGRAILHAEELTYSVVLPAETGLTSQEIYKKVSTSLVKGLRLYDNALSGVELEKTQPDFAGLLKDPSGVMCFASTARSEIKYKGLKLVGSAQRKMDKVILQHGSILCGNYHLRLIDYLCIDEKRKEEFREEFFKKTTDLSSILNRKIDYISLVEKLRLGFMEEWNVTLTDY